MREHGSSGNALARPGLGVDGLNRGGAGFPVVLSRWCHPLVRAAVKLYLRITERVARDSSCPVAILPVLLGTYIRF